MPIDQLTTREVRALAKEARTFATLITKISKDKDAPPHPEIGAMVRSFQRINAYLSTGKGPAIVTLGNKARIGREFEKIGSSLRGHKTR